MPAQRKGRLARFFFLLVLAFVPAVFAPRDAGASVSIAVTYDALLARSVAACVVSPAEQRAVWENGRIYTYTRVGIERAAFGSLKTGDEAWIRTMGGVVGKLGQIVEGEAVLTVGRSSLLFLTPGPSGTYDVTARAQGQFPVVLDENKAQVIHRSGGIGALLPPHGEAASHRLAADVLHGRALDDALRAVSSDWAAAHAR